MGHPPVQYIIKLTGTQGPGDRPAGAPLGPAWLPEDPANGQRRPKQHKSWKRNMRSRLSLSAHHSSVVFRYDNIVDHHSDDSVGLFRRHTSVALVTTCSQSDPIPQPAAARTPRLHQPSAVTHLFYAYVRKATNTEFNIVVLGRDLILAFCHIVSATAEPCLPAAGLGFPAAGLVIPAAGNNNNSNRIQIPNTQRRGASPGSVHIINITGIHGKGDRPAEPTLCPAWLPEDPANGPSQIGGRHSNPVVTTPMIALDFSGTTHQSASHNVAPNQVIKSICPGSICMVSPSQIGGRHSNPVVTTPMIALDFSGTTHQSASHNVAPNQFYKSTQALTTRTKLKTTKDAHPEVHASRRKTRPRFLPKTSNASNSTLLDSTLIQGLKCVAIKRAKLGEFNATKIVKNRGRKRRESAVESYGERQ
ncbi:hypothetical protein F511_14913 [Dorcoceras hygrometricum]|uniref:Uncharacterized protein n=1 Tax=Dorcoceras hygrometricum TaxID=472368 RepID=A0A2Z7C0I4_9LAMI|nr:hypothetical protein F511_14913 [Dorcoceras hygrometricum]